MVHNKNNLLKILLLLGLSLFSSHNASAADLSLQIDFIDEKQNFVGSTFPTPELQKILNIIPEFTPLKDLSGDPHKKDIPLKTETIKVKANFQMSGLGYPNVEITKSEYKRFRNTLERKLLLNLFALSNHPAEILSEKDVSDKQNEKTLLIESALFTPLIKEETLIVDEESSNLLKSTATGLETGWQIVGTFESELKVVTGYLKVPETAPTKQ